MNTKRITILFIIVIVVLISSLLFFRKNDNYKKIGNNKNQILVTTSFYPLSFFASQIGGKMTKVINLTPAGAEPHDYELTAQDLINIESSRLLIMNGLGLEAWSKKLKQNLNSKDLKIIIVGKQINKNDLITDKQNGIDPHIWLDPKLTKKIVKTISQALIDIDSKNKEYYLKNTKILLDKLNQLNNSYHQVLNNCSQHNIITAHAAFAYLSRNYGLQQMAITGLSPEAEASPQQLAKIVRFARQQKIKYIFFEKLVSPKLSQTIAKEIGAKTLVLDPLESLSKNDIQSGKNYFSIMKDNLNNLKLALQCQ